MSSQGHAKGHSPGNGKDHVGVDCMTLCRVVPCCIRACRFLPTFVCVAMGDCCWRCLASTEFPNPFACQAQKSFGRLGVKDRHGDWSYRKISLMDKLHRSTKDRSAVLDEDYPGLCYTYVSPHYWSPSISLMRLVRPDASCLTKLPLKKPTSLG
ncbi:unnamed protein product [Fusarium venenatum]|uniref:Uncharacterized protein n=1 Tax=Fusarium venenatum TaxID=56646 RepID=A0A2L2TBY9_9HYPO|nr:uncharacterized protein FVRRES_08581 [Fusarium venenatum]CEI68504.1 unnamed protein product [Fusarium venenatum]